MKHKIILIGLLVLAMALPTAVSYAQESTEEAPIVETARHRLRLTLREALDIITEATGLSGVEIRQQMQDGATLSEIIAANGGDVEVVKAEVTTLFSEAIESAVSDGRLTRERADEMLTNLPERISQLFDELHDMEGRPYNMAERGLFRNLAQTVMDATGLTRDEIAEEIQAGSTLSEIIAANGGDVEAIKTEVLADATERVNARVESGDLTQEDADAILAQAETELNGWLDGSLEFPIFAGHDGRGGRGEGRGARGN